MESDDMVKTLIKLFMDEQKIKYASTHSCELRNLIDEMQCILDIQIRIVALRWEKFFDANYDKMIESPDSYLTSVIHACIREHQCRREDIFDSFISICAVVKFLCEETLQKTDMDMQALNSDIVMELYLDQLQSKFLSSGGWEKFVRYIHDHKYFQWEFDSTEGTEFYPLFFGAELEAKLEIESKRNPLIVNEPYVILREKVVNSFQLAMKVISTASAKLPTLPNPRYLDLRLAFYSMAEKREKLRIGGLRLKIFRNALMSSLMSVPMNTKVVVECPAFKESIWRIVLVFCALAESEKPAEQVSEIITELLKLKRKKGKTDLQENSDRFLDDLNCKKNSLNSKLTENEEMFLRLNSEYCLSLDRFNMAKTELLKIASAPVTIALCSYFDALGL